MGAHRPRDRAESWGKVASQAAIFTEDRIRKISLEQVIVNAPPELREELQPLSKMALINRCAALRPGPVTTILASSKYTLRAIARRWQQLNAEITGHEKVLAQLTSEPAPDLSAAFAVGPDTAA